MCSQQKWLLSPAHDRWQSCQRRCATRLFVSVSISSLINTSPGGEVLLLHLLLHLLHFILHLLLPVLAVHDQIYNRDVGYKSSTANGYIYMPKSIQHTCQHCDVAKPPRDQWLPACKNYHNHK